MNPHFPLSFAHRCLRAAGSLALAAVLVAPGAIAQTKSQTHKHPAHKPAAHAHAAHGKSARATRTKVILRKHGRRHPLSAKALARTHKIQQAFIASSQLRPMAQQLGNYRSPAAYAGVAAYAHAHTGEASAAAYLALGHAYLLDRKFPEALAALHQADVQGDALDDYAAYFSAQVDLQSNQPVAAEAILSSFATKYPDSIFNSAVPVLEANLYIEQGDPQAALRVLRAHAGEPVAGKPDYLLAEAKAEQMAGQASDATALFRRVVATAPLSNEATLAQAQLTQSGQWQTLPIEERRRHADTLFNAGRWAPAAEDFARSPVSPRSARASATRYSSRLPTATGSSSG